MRVVQFGPFPPPWGGVQANLAAIREHLATLGIESGVVNLTRHRRESGGGVFYPRSAAGTLGLLLRLPARILHVHIGGAVQWRGLALLAVCALLPGKRTVLSFHSGGYPSSPEGRSARWWSLRGFVFRLLDRIIAVNPELAAVFRRYGVAESRIRLITPFAIGESDVAADLPPVLEAFFASHSPVLLSVGLLESEYGLARQIELMDAVRRRHPRAGLAIVGSGSLEPELRARIAATDYRDHLLLAGDVPRPRTLLAIRRAAVLLRTTLYDGDALSVREALALGTPVIATDNGMRPEGVVKIAGVEELAGAVEEILAHPPARVARQDSGRANLDAVVAVYRELGL